MKLLKLLLALALLSAPLVMAQPALSQSKDQANQAANIIINTPKPLALQYTKGQLKNQLLFGSPESVQRYCSQNLVNRNECIGTANILKQFKR